MTHGSAPPDPEVADVVFLLDVDNTLLDNDRFAAELGARLEQSFGAAERNRYWAIYAATFMAITATRAMYLAYGFDRSEIESANPIIPDIEAFLEEADL